MPSTEPHFRRRVVWAAGLLVVLMAYLMLGLADWLLARWLDRQITLANAPARALEAQRAEVQDAPQIAAARLAGFRAVLFPALFEHGVFEAMMRRHGVLPLGAQPSTRLVYCNEGTGLVTYASDRFGFRNEDAAWNTPEVTVALLGDSFVHGACVAQHHTIGGRLSEAGNAVVNLGTSGNNSLMHAAVARAFLPALRPRHAILVFYANDNDDEEDSAIRPWALLDQPDYLVRVGRQLQPGPAYRRLAPLWAEAEAEAQRQYERAQAGPAAQLGATADSPRIPKWLLLTSMRSLGKAAYQRWTGGPLPWSSRLAIDTLAAQCKQAGCSPSLVYLPNSPFWRPDPRAEGYRQALLAYAAKHHPGMAWIDTSGELGRLGSAAYAPTGPHLSSAGYAVVAAAIEQALLRPGLR